MQSGRQERGRRGGTENLPGIVGFAAAVEATSITLADDLARMQALQQQLEAGLRAMSHAVVVVGDAVQRLPNTVCLRFGRLDAEQVLNKLERAGVVASSGAACTAAGTQPSHVLLAMGASRDEAKASVRLSLGRETTADDIAQTLSAVRRAVLPLLLDARPHVAALLPPKGAVSALGRPGGADALADQPVWSMESP